MPRSGLGWPASRTPAARRRRSRRPARPLRPRPPPRRPRRQNDDVLKANLLPGVRPALLGPGDPITGAAPPTLAQRVSGQTVRGAVLVRRARTAKGERWGDCHLRSGLTHHSTPRELRMHVQVRIAAIRTHSPLVGRRVLSCADARRASNDAFRAGRMTSTDARLVARIGGAREGCISGARRLSYH